MQPANNPVFSGYENPNLPKGYAPPELPRKVKLIDSNKFVQVNLDKMILEGDERTEVLSLNRRASLLNSKTSTAYYFVALHALNGRRKVSTLVRWDQEFDLFLRTLEPHVSSTIGSITFEMYNWYASLKNPSQQKLLRSLLLYWIGKKQPGIAGDLADYLVASKSPKPRSSIEIQNQVPRERPFSVGETRQILSRVDQLFIAGGFGAQENLLWRLTVCEGLRPTQMTLLKFGDLRFSTDRENGPVTLDVPCIKQKGKAGRQHMLPVQATASVASALREQWRSVHEILGCPPPATLPLFCKLNQKGERYANYKAISINGAINSTRKLVSAGIADLEENDFFTRRFKHTKLTHLAMLGAPLPVLARAGFQTTTVSLRRYVNLTEEAFADFEARMSDEHAFVLDAFKGSVIEPAHASNPDSEHAIFDTDLNSKIGSCAGDPCDVFAPVGCYLCPRFEAFSDGTHNSVLSFLKKRKSLAKDMKLSADSIARDDSLIGAVEEVIRLIGKTA